MSDAKVMHCKTLFYSVCCKRIHIFEVRVVLEKEKFTLLVPPFSELLALLLVQNFALPLQTQSTLTAVYCR